jgi:hypothetical protein
MLYAPNGKKQMVKNSSEHDSTVHTVHTVHSVSIVHSVFMRNDTYCSILICIFLCTRLSYYLSVRRTAHASTGLSGAGVNLTHARQRVVWPHTRLVPSPFSIKNTIIKYWFVKI